MKETIVFALLLFAIFQLSKAEAPVKKVVANRTVTQEKPAHVEKRIVVKPKIVERRIVRIYVAAVKDCQRSGVNYPSPEGGIYPSSSETRITKERRNYREDRTLEDRSLNDDRVRKETSEEIDQECSFKAPNFFGAETKCQQWRKEHGYDY